MFYGFFVCSTVKVGAHPVSEGVNSRSEPTRESRCSKRFEYYRHWSRAYPKHSLLSRGTLAPLLQVAVIAGDLNVGSLLRAGGPFFEYSLNWLVQFRLAPNLIRWVLAELNEKAS